MKTHDIIYLQTHDDDGHPWDEVTWCQDRINDTDVPYVRMDKYQEAVDLLQRMQHWAISGDIITLAEEIGPAIDEVLETAVVEES